MSYMPFDYEVTQTELAKKIHESAELWRKIMTDMDKFADLQQEIGILTYKYNQQKALGSIANEA